MPKPWEALKNPKWQGKAIVSSSGADALLLFAYLWREKENELNWEKSFAYWSEVIKNTKPHIGRAPFQVMELVAAGEYPLFLLGFGTVTMTYIERGGPIAFAPVGTTVGSNWGLAMPKTVPHPNAAKLFIECLASPDGLLRYADANYAPVLDPEVVK